MTYVKVALSDVRFNTTPERECVVSKASPFREKGSYIRRHVYVETIDHGGNLPEPVIGSPLPLPPLVWPFAVQSPEVEPRRLIISGIGRRRLG